MNDAPGQRPAAFRLAKLTFRRPPVRGRLLAAAIGALAAGCGGPDAPPAAPRVAPAAAGELRPPEVFDAIADPAERSRAIFVEASRVLLHPRCVNCHPADNSPRQGDALALHEPPAWRGERDEGVVGMQCGSCHQDANLEFARVPGAPKWHLAPIAMAWVGKSPAAVCEQLKDPKRNGGKTLAAIADHSAHDALVGWGWAPGSGRVPAPGSQARFGALVAAWVRDGAACPAEGVRP